MMKSGIEIGFVREYYKKLSDEDMTKAAMEAVPGLSIEAKQVIKEEIIRRGLDDDLVKALENNAAYPGGHEKTPFNTSNQTLSLQKTATPSIKYLITFVALHLLLFFIYGLSIAIFDELNNELFAYLLFTALIFGIPGTIIQTILFTLLPKSFELSTNYFGGIVLLVEFTFMNVAYKVTDGTTLTGILINSIGRSSSTTNPLCMHLAIIISTVIIARSVSNFLSFKNKRWISNAVEANNQKGL